MSYVSTGLRVTGALLLVGSLGALAVAGDRIAVPGEVPAEEIAHTVQLAAGTGVLVCPAAPAPADAVVVVDDEFAQVTGEAETSLDAISLPRTGGAASPGTIRDLVGREDALERSGELLAEQRANPDTVTVFAVEPSGDEAGLAAGTAQWRLDGGDLRALSASPCLPPALDQWLIGGSGTIGHAARLTLTNPSQTPATATVTLYGPLGALDAPLLRSIVIAPESSFETLLGAHAPDVPLLAAHVVSSGAAITASIAHSAIAGLTPHGFDIVTPSAHPASGLVIPGVALTAAAEQEDQASPSSTAEGSAIRLVNPNAEEARASLVLLGPDGEIPIPGADDVAVSPGAVFEVSLAGLPAGDYAVRIDSDIAVAAGAVLARGVEELDRTWIPSGDPMVRATAAVSGADRLIVTALEDSEATVTLWNAQGERIGERVVPLAAGTTGTIPLESAAAMELTATSPVVGAAVFEEFDAGLVSVLPLTPDANEQHSVDVRVVN